VSPPEDPSGRAPELVHLVREPAGDPEGALILLHGRGVDERDLYPMLDELDPDRRLFAITPGGPVTNLPPGGRHWYVVERVGYPDESTFLQTIEPLCGFLDGTLDARGISWEKTVIGGFSQGAVMACAVAVGADRPRAAGLLMCSGFYPEVPGWPMDPGAKRDMPAYLTHGVHDPVIPIDFGRRARDLLTAGGLDVTYREAPVQHGIDFRLIPEMRGWVTSVISGEVPKAPA